MCLRTIYSFDRCDCRVDHLRICRPHIAHTHKQIDTHGCWDYRVDTHHHTDRWCSSRRCMSHRCQVAPGTSGTIEEYSVEQEYEYRDRTQQEQYKGGDNKLKARIKVEADLKAEVDVKMESNLDETVKKLMDMSAVKDEGTEPSPIKGPEVKRIRQEALDREQDAWKQREQEWNQREQDWKKQEKKMERKARRKTRQFSGRARNANAVSPPPHSSNNSKSGNSNNRRKKAPYKSQNIKQEPIDDRSARGFDYGYQKIKQEPLDDEEMSGGVYGATGFLKVKEEKFCDQYLSDPFLDGACDGPDYMPENRLGFYEPMDDMSGSGGNQNELFHGKYGGEPASPPYPRLGETHWTPINKLSEWQLRDVPSEEELCGQKSSRGEAVEEYLEDRDIKD